MTVRTLSNNLVVFKKYFHPKSFFFSADVEAVETVDLATGRSVDHSPSPLSIGPLPSPFSTQHTDEEKYPFPFPEAMQTRESIGPVPLRNTVNYSTDKAYTQYSSLSFTQNI